MRKNSGLRIRIEKEHRAAFVQACRREGRTASDVIRDFVISYIGYEAKKHQPDLFNTNLNL